MWTSLSFRFPLILLLCVAIAPHRSLQAASHDRRALKELSATQIATLVSQKDPLQQLDHTNPSSHLSRILIPRVSGTANNTLVKDYIISTLRKLNWHIQEDNFTDTTPLGKKPFTNVIATKDPKASRRIILAAHFDSKYFSTEEFLGATDSAASCAMMLDLAEALDPLLEKRKKAQEAGEAVDDDVADTTLQLVFFDGEEAFVSWTDTDSIYGARHLAAKWQETYVTNDKQRLLGNPMTELSTIEHLVLLDLLGAPNPLIRSYFIDTAWLFDAMASVERRLGESGAFTYGNEKSMAPGKWKSYFRKRTKEDSNLGYMGDDHVPFLQRGVSVLHVITEPFPAVWHTPRDDASALDFPTMRRWNIMLRVFMSEYLNLSPEEVKTTRADEQNASKRSEAEL
ncbi:hypothetical protein HGRIS_012765 [Hohenbuehelia grisea]